MATVSGDSRLVLTLLLLDGAETVGVMLGDLWHRASRKGRLDRTLRRLEEHGLVSRMGEGPLDERIYRLTGLGRKVVHGVVDVESRWQRAWDGRWRLVIFDVPQSKVALRTRLRRRLRELRFGWLQNSVWLSPDPTNELVRLVAHDRATVESLLFMEGRPNGGESDAELVAGAWDFARLGKAHADYLQILRLQPRGRRSEAVAWQAWIQSEERAWEQVVRLDPFLPEALWPDNYKGREVWRARAEALHAAAAALRRMVGAS